MSEKLKAAFAEMRRTEMALDDMDYLTNSPRLQKAIEAAAEFNRQLEAHENAKHVRHVSPYDLSAIRRERP